MDKLWISFIIFFHSACAEQRLPSKDKGEAVKLGKLGPRGNSWDLPKPVNGSDASLPWMVG